MNAIDPQDETRQDETRQDGSSQDGSSQDGSSPGAAPERRWVASGLRHRLMPLFWALFVVVGVVLTLSLAHSDGWYPIAFMIVWWVGLISTGVAQLRIATRVELYADGSLLLVAPVRVVHTHVTRLQRLREIRRRGNSGWGAGESEIELVTADGTMRMSGGLMTEDLVDVLRAGSPDMAIPFFRGGR